MAWMMFTLGAFVGGIIGVMVMALAVTAGTGSADERSNASYWRGRRDEKRRLQVDQMGSKVKH